MRRILCGFSWLAWLGLPLLAQEQRPPQPIKVPVAPAVARPVTPSAPVFPAQLLRRLRISDRAPIVGVAFVPGTRTIVVLQQSNTLMHLDAQTGAILANWQAPELSAVGGLAVAPDGRSVAVGTYRGITLLALPGLKERWVAGPLPESESYGPIANLAFSPDGKQLVAGGNGWPLNLLAVTDGSVVRTESSTKVIDGLRMLRFSRDGSAVFLAGAIGRDGNAPPIPHAARWNLNGGKVDWLEKLPQRLVAYALWEQPDGLLALHGAQQSAIRRLDPQTLQVVSSTSFLAGWAAAVSGDGRRYAFARQDGFVHPYDSAQPQLRLGMFSTETRPDQLALNHDGTELLVGADNGDLQHWRLKYPSLADEPASALFAENAFAPADLSVPEVAGPDEEGIVRYEGHRGTILTLLPYPDSTHVLTAGFDQRVRLWDLTQRKLASRFDGVAGKAFDLYFGAAVSADGEKLLLAGGQYRGTHSVALWHPQRLEKRLVLGGTTDTTHRVALAPDGKRAAAAGNNHDVVIWDTGTGNETARIKLPQPNQNNLGFFAVALTLDGKQVLTSQGSEVSLWSAEDGKLVAIAETGQCQVIRPRPGTTEIVIDTGRGVSFLSLPDLALKRQIPFPQHFRSAAFSADGMRLALGGGDRLEVWDLKQNVQVLLRTGKIDQVSLTPDGKTVLWTEANTLATLRLE